MQAAIAVEKSSNRKTGPISVTYACSETCPKNCPIKDECYGKNGFIPFITKRLGRSRSSCPSSMAFQEGQEIKKLSGKRPLRLHIVGDCRTWAAARELSVAAAYYHGKHGQPVWTYTHCWRTVPRSVVHRPRTT